MKKYRHFKTILFCLCVLSAVNSNAQQEYTLTTSAANIISAKALIDMPGLSGNTNAIIIATPLGNTKTLNPHPTGAWYYSGKWNIFNSDFAPMPVGMIYKVQYFLTPGANQFLHLVTQENLGAEGSYIDNPALNNKPNAQLAIFLNHAPNIRTGSWPNPNEAKAAYSAASGRWYITNINGQPMLKGGAYNIVVSSGGTTNPVINPVQIDNTSLSCKCPVSLPPNGLAKGDLSGNYPEPTVMKILGRPLSNTAPASGQVLKWNGVEWSPSNDNAGSGNGNSTIYSAGPGLALNGTEFTATASTPMWNASQILGRNIVTTAPKVGQILKWGGTAWYPANDSVANTTTNSQGSPSNPLYNNTTMLNGFSTLTLTSSGSTTSVPLSGLSSIYYFKTNVKVMVSFNVPANTIQCFSCGITGVYIFLNVNGSLAQRYYWEIANNSSLLLSGSNLLSLPPGEHKIELVAQAFGPSVNLGYSQTRSTMIIQVIPEQ